jgi:hypothetical protein
MLASIMAALKAIPAIVEGIKELKSSILYMADNRTDTKISEIKQTMRLELEAIKNTENRDEMLKRIHILNTKLSDRQQYYRFLNKSDIVTNTGQYERISNYCLDLRKELIKCKRNK